jgi:hypothetical protein
MSVSPPASPPPKSPLAVWSFVCGILTYCCLGPLAGLAAIFCGHLARGAIKRAAGSLGGGGLAIAGLVLGYTGTVITSLVLLGWVITAMNSANDAAARRRASSEVRQIVEAVHRFETEYGRLPDVGGDGSHDVTLAQDNDRLFNILRAIDRDHAGNPKRIVFFDGLPQWFGSNGVFQDPWGNPFLIRMDMNGDNRVENPYGRGPGDTLRETVIAWSLGKDALPGKDGKGDVLSWTSTSP